MRRFGTTIGIGVLLLALAAGMSACAVEPEPDDEWIDVPEVDPDRESDESGDTGPTGSERDEADDEALFTLGSPAFADGGAIPVKYANTGVEGGENVSPPLEWEDPPEGTLTFAISMVDRHPVANRWVHWLVVNIPADVTSLSEGASTAMHGGASQPKNTFGETGYGGPQPPAGSGDHDYQFSVYALRTENVDLPADVALDEFLDAVQPQMLGFATVTGVFGR